MSSFPSVIEKVKAIASDDKRIKETLSGLKKTVGEVAKTTKRETFNFLNGIFMFFVFLLKMLPIIALIFIGLTFGGLVMAAPYNVILSFLVQFEGTLGPTLVVFISATITFYVIFLITVMMLPIDTEKKQAFAAKTFPLFIFILLIVGAFFYIRDSTAYEPEELGQLAANRTAQSFSDMIETFTCALSYECTQQKLSTNQATTTSRADFSISFDSPSISRFMKDDLDQTLPFVYEVQSSEPVKITKIECREGRASNEPFYTEDLEISITSENKIPVPLKCENLDQIELTGKLEDYNIIIHLYFTTQTSYSQEIPVAEYNYIVSKSNLDPFNSYSYFQLADTLREETRSITGFSQTNDAISVEIEGLQANLPLLVGDSENREITFALTIEGDNRDLGSLLAWRLIEFEKPASLEFREEINIEEDILVQGDDNKATKFINFRETDSVIVDDIGIQSLEMVIESDFRLEDRFKITITDPTFEQITGEPE